MTSALMPYDSAATVRDEVLKLREQIEEVLPARVDPDRFLRVVTKAVIENPKLMQCTRVSILASIHEAAQLGLEPSGLLGSAYLVPYSRRVNENGTWRSVYEAQLIPGYRGLIDLARRSGEIDAIEAEVVRHRDVFSIVKGTNARLTHIPFIPDPTAAPEERDRGPVVGAYMKAVLRGGHEQYEWMTYDDIEAIRKRSKAADGGPWVTDWNEMARKTVVRRGSKYLPMTTDFRRALELDEEAERQADPVPVAEVVERSKATQMILDREQARRRPVEAARIPDQGEAPDGGVSAPSDEHLADSGEPSDADAPSGDPTAVCEDVNPDLGRCSRAPGHTGGHRNAEGVWPKAKA